MVAKEDRLVNSDDPEEEHAWHGGHRHAADGGFDKAAGRPVEQPTLWSLRGMFFWHYFGVSFYYPYVILWMRKVGLSNSSVGAINTMRSLATMFCVPLWGMVADRSSTKTVLMALICVATLLRFSTIQCTSFYSLFAVCLLSDFFGSPLEPFLDSTSLSTLQDSSQYGRYRLWGTIGWGWVGSPLAGRIASSEGVEALFWIHAVVMLIPMLIISQLQIKPFPKRDKGSILDVVSLVCKSQGGVFFFIAALMVGQGLGLIVSFSFLQLEDMGDTGIIMGLASLVQCLAEVPVFWLSQRAIASLGVIRAVQLSLLAVVLRFFVYAVMTQPHQILFVEWLHGYPLWLGGLVSCSSRYRDLCLGFLPMFGLMWAAGTGLCRELAPPGMEMSMQAFFTSWVIGFGSLSGNLLGGLLATHYRIPFLFGIYAALALSMLCASLVAEAVGLVDLQMPNAKAGQGDGLGNQATLGTPLVVTRPISDGLGDGLGSQANAGAKAGRAGGGAGDGLPYVEMESGLRGHAGYELVAVDGAAQ